MSERVAEGAAVQGRECCEVRAHRRGDAVARRHREHARQALDQQVRGAEGLQTGGVPGAAAGADAQPERPLLGDLDAPPADPALGRHAVAAAFVEHQVDVAEELGIALEHEGGAFAAAGLLARHREQDDAAAQGRATPLEIDHRGDLGDAEALRIERTAADERAALDRAGEGRRGPAGSGLDDVDVVREKNGVGARAVEAGVEAHPALRVDQQARSDAFALEHLGEKGRGGALVARRVGGVEAQVGLQPARGLRQRLLRRGDAARRAADGARDRDRADQSTPMSSHFSKSSGQKKRGVA